MEKNSNEIHGRGVGLIVVGGGIENYRSVTSRPLPGERFCCCRQRRILSSPSVAQSPRADWPGRPDGEIS